MALSHFTVMQGPLIMLRGQGLSHIWNGGIKEIQVPDSISPGVFWAAGKLYALKAAHMPAVMVDLDLIVWKNIGGIHSGDGYLCNTQRRNISGCISRQGLLQYGQFVQL